MLSFLIPAYDSADVVAEAVESALAQSIDEELEVVAVDDCSPDATYRVLDGLAGRHAALRVFRHEENRGGGPTRNSAAAHARGNLLYVLDADNVLPEGSVQPQLDELRRRGASAVSVGMLQFIDGTTGEHRHRWEQAQDDGWSSLRHAFEALAVPAAHGNYLYTRAMFEAVGGYEPDLGAVDTWSFGLKHLAQGFDVAIAEGAHYLHRIERPKSDSYWIRDQRLGQNDRNALIAIRRQWHRLPPDLQLKVDAMEPNDPFFACVAEGVFRQSVDEAEFTQAAARARAAQLRGVSVAGRLRIALGQLLGR
jgi:glycosyltransferase involved in cell wall biosynthesis